MDLHVTAPIDPCGVISMRRWNVVEQEGLKAQQSRMDVDLPFAARLGVETTDDDKGKKVHAYIIWPP